MKYYVVSLALLLFVNLRCLALETENDPYLIALDADFSGGAKLGGISIKRGAELAIEEINSNGGLLGKKLQLVISDHRGNPARGVDNVIAHMAQPNLIAVLAGVHTPVALQQLEPIHNKGVPFLIPWAAGTPITDNAYVNNSVFRISLRDSEAASAILEDAKRNNIESVSLILERTGWGRSNLSSLSKQAKILGITIDEVIWFNWRQSSFDMLSEEIEIKENKAMIMVANPPEGKKIVEHISGSELASLDLYSHWGIAAADFAKMVDKNVLSNINLRVLQSFHLSKASNKPKLSSLITRYNEKYNQNETPYSLVAGVGLAHSYDLVMMLAAVVESSQSATWEDSVIGLLEIEEYQGLIKTYKQPFRPDFRDALLAEDYLLATYNEKGWLVPVDE